MTSSTIKRLEAHLFGTKQLLATLEGQPCLDSVAQGQCETFLASLGNVSLTVAHASALSELVAKAAWPAKLSSQMLQAIAEHTSTAPALGSYRSMLQNWEYINQYITMEGWHCLSAHSVSHEGKLHLLLDLAIALGLRWPTEASMQMVATLHKISCEGPEQVKLLGYDEKLQAVRHVKRIFHRKISGLPPPLHHVANLHATSAAFKAEFPQVYASVYKASEPVISPIPEHIMRELQYSFPMRSTKKVAPTTAQMNELLLQQVLQMAGRALGLSGEHCFGGGSSKDPLRIQMLTPPPQLPVTHLQQLPAPTPEPTPQKEQLTPPTPEPPQRPVAQLTLPPAKSLATPKGPKPTVEEVTQDILKGMAEKADEHKGKSKATAKANSKAQPEPKATVKPTITKLGCSKCRYARNGCAQCKQRLAKAMGLA